MEVGKWRRGLDEPEWLSRNLDVHLLREGLVDQPPDARLGEQVRRPQRASGGSSRPGTAEGRRNAHDNIHQIDQKPAQGLRVQRRRRAVRGRTRREKGGRGPSRGRDTHRRAVPPAPRTADGPPAKPDDDDMDGVKPRPAPAKTPTRRAHLEPWGEEAAGRAGGRQSKAHWRRRRRRRATAQRTVGELSAGEAAKTTSSDNVCSGMDVPSCHATRRFAKNQNHQSSEEAI